MLELEHHRCLMVVNIHHIIFDGVSLGVFVEEFMDLYAGKELPEVKLQYKDFSQWQNSAQQQEAIKRQKEYWLREFSDEVPLLQLPTDFPRAEVNTFAGDVLDFALSSEETRALEGLASAEGATMYMVILAIYNVFLSKLSGQEDIVVGASAAGRTHEELHRVIGMFVNALALRNYPEGEKTFSEFLREVKARTTAAFENQDLLFEELVEAAAVERHPNRNPLFDVMFVLNNMEIREVNIPGLKLSPYPHQTRSAQMDLKLRGEQQDGILALKFEYSTTLFKPDTMATFAGNFKEITAKILENVEIKLKEIPITYELAEAESKIALEQVDFGF